MIVLYPRKYAYCSLKESKVKNTVRFTARKTTILKRAPPLSPPPLRGRYWRRDISNRVLRAVKPLASRRRERTSIQRNFFILGLGEERKRGAYKRFDTNARTSFIWDGEFSPKKKEKTWKDFKEGELFRTKFKGAIFQALMQFSNPKSQYNLHHHWTFPEWEKD